jgi:folate-binding protein YgfZ
MKAALLPDRGVVKVAGDTARNFLNGLFTTDIGPVTHEDARFGALLTPQGKILLDFVVVAEPGEAGFLFDCPRALAKTLVDKLNFYKLRAKITAEDISDTRAVLAAWDGAGANSAHAPFWPDPRLAALGWRAIVTPDQAGEAARGLEMVDAGHYEAHRIALGVPQGELDFGYGDAFPHEADMDQLNGVDFAKGCYVGQEVVSRMEHRATVRTRVVPVAYEGGAPAPGEPVTAGDKAVGTMGSSAKGRALALLRLDRVADALAAGTPLVCGGVTLSPVRPEWARFAWPGTKAAE